MEESGYIVAHTVAKTQIVTSKAGAKVKAKGIESDAGAGSAIEPQSIPPIP